MALFPQGVKMQKRRQFLKIVFGCITAIGLLPGLTVSAVRRLYAKAQETILLKNTTSESVIHNNPRSHCMPLMNKLPL